jgi:hypothetical protein
MFCRRGKTKRLQILRSCFAAGGSIDALMRAIFYGAVRAAVLESPAKRESLSAGGTLSVWI